jgi:hypothetical protein
MQWGGGAQMKTGTKHDKFSDSTLEILFADRSQAPLKKTAPKSVGKAITIKLVPREQ